MEVMGGFQINDVWPHFLLLLKFSYTHLSPFISYLFFITNVKCMLGRVEEGGH